MCIQQALRVGTRPANTVPAPLSRLGMDLIQQTQWRPYLHNYVIISLSHSRLFSRTPSASQNPKELPTSSMQRIYKVPPTVISEHIRTKIAEKNTYYYPQAHAHIRLRLNACSRHSLHDKQHVSISSRRTTGSSARLPLTATVLVLEACFSTPRASMQRCIASSTTMVPAAPARLLTASASWCVKRSCNSQIPMSQVL